MLYEKQEDADKRKRSQSGFAKNKFPTHCVTKEFQLPPLKQSSESTNSHSTQSSTKAKSITVGTTPGSTALSNLRGRSTSKGIAVSHSKHDSQPLVHPYTTSRLKPRVPWSCNRSWDQADLLTHSENVHLLHAGQVDNIKIAVSHESTRLAICAIINFVEPNFI